MADQKAETTTPPAPPASSETPEIKKRGGLVLKIFLLYLLLTMANILIFGVGVFGKQLDQIRIVNEAIAMKLTNEMVNVLQAIPPNKKNKKKKAKKKAVKKAVKRIAKIDGTELEEFIVLDYNKQTVYDDNDSILIAVGMDKDDIDDDTKESLAEYREVVEAKQNKSLYNKKATFNFFDGGKKIKILIPFQLVKGETQVFVTSLENKAFENQTNETYRLFAFLIGFILIMQILFGYIVYRMLVKPIRKLQGASLELAGGDLATRVDLVGKGDELESLAESFNFMAGSLEEKTEQLNIYIKELEDQKKIVEMELEMAQAIQLGMLPKLKDTKRFKFGIYYKALETISGDYYDAFRLPNGNVGFLIGDASGHGIPAALVTILAKSSFSTRAHLFDRPGKMLEVMNKLMCSAITTSDYMTAFYNILTPDNKMYYCNGGHQKIMIHRKATNTIEELDSSGFFLGSMDELPIEFETKETQIEAGDRLILFTDGIPEAKNPQKDEFTIERFMECIISYRNMEPQEMVDKIAADSDVFSDGVPRADDYTLICIEIMK